jgi:hypothetical protein
MLDRFAKMRIAAHAEPGDKLDVRSIGFGEFVRCTAVHGGNEA